MIIYRNDHLETAKQTETMLRLLCFRRVRHAKPYAAPPTTLQHPKFFYVSSGCLHVIVCGKKVTVEDDRFILLKPGCSVEYYLPTASAIVSELEFEASGLAFYDELEDNYIIGKNTHVGDLLYHLHGFVQKKPMVPFSPEALLTLILEQALSSADMNIPGQELYHRFREYVDNHIGDDLSAIAISEALRYNKDYICRVVKRFSGKTLKEYIVCERLIVAKTMLSTGDMPVGNIATAVGCVSPELFCKFFRYYTHMAPLKYRRQFRKEV